MTSSLADEASLKGGILGHPPNQQRKRRNRLVLWLIVSLAVLVVVGLAVGLGVGLTVGRRGGDDGDDDNDNDSGSSTSSTNAPMANFTSTNTSAYWTPTSGTTWNYVLQDTLSNTSTNSIIAWGIDLFNNNASTIAGLQSNGAKVICYFSAGSYENWRPDKDNFSSADLGSNLQGWPGEKWLNISSQNVRNIMLARLDMAVEKRCDGVDPDNVDGYSNKNGLGLTPTDSVLYMEFLANAAHDRNLAIGLKNAGGILPNVIDGMQWSINEQCTQYQECSTFAPFIQQGKPVFHVEYPKGDNTNNANDVDAATKVKYCDDPQAQGFSTILKNIDLDTWIEEC